MYPGFGHVDYNFNYCQHRTWQPGDPLIIDAAVARAGGLKLNHVPVSITCLTIPDKSAASK